MKTNKSTRRFGIVSVFLLLLSCVASPALDISLIAGYNTNQVVTVGGTNYPIGYFPASSTNYFNLTVTNGAQPNTNEWPSSVFSTSGGLPGTGIGNYIPGNANYQSFNNFGLFSTAAQATTNAVANVSVIDYAGTMNGIIWQSNLFSTSFTPTANVVTYWSISQQLVSTNWQSIAVQDVRVPLTTGGVTNVTVDVGTKPGCPNVNVN